MPLSFVLSSPEILSLSLPTASYQTQIRRLHYAGHSSPMLPRPPGLQTRTQPSLTTSVPANLTHFRVPSRRVESIYAWTPPYHPTITSEPSSLLTPLGTHSRDNDPGPCTVSSCPSRPVQSCLRIISLQHQCTTSTSLIADSLLAESRKNRHNQIPYELALFTPAVI